LADRAELAEAFTGDGEEDDAAVAADREAHVAAHRRPDRAFHEGAAVLAQDRAEDRLSRRSLLR
jgi:hypothetical protein